MESNESLPRTPHLMHVSWSVVAWPYCLFKPQPSGHAWISEQGDRIEPMGTRPDTTYYTPIVFSR